MSAHVKKFSVFCTGDLKKRVSTLFWHFATILSPNPQSFPHTNTWLFQESSSCPPAPPPSTQDNDRGTMAQSSHTGPVLSARDSCLFLFPGPLLYIKQGLNVLYGIYYLYAMFALSLVSVPNYLSILYLHIF